jgi:hypothetical protein
MRIIMFIVMLLGILMSFIAYQGEINEWNPVELFLVLGLTGYVLIITAIAWFLLRFLNKHLKDFV